MILHEIEKNVHQFRTTIMFREPFYGEIIHHIPFISDPEIKTACTDGSSIRYSPKFFGKLNQGQQNYVLMHELMHILLQHKQRSRYKRPDLWNAACDLVVNQILDKRLTPHMISLGLPFERPPQGLFTENSYHFKPAETYYEELVKANPVKKKTVKYILAPAFGSKPARTIEKPVPTDLPAEESDTPINQELADVIRQTISDLRSRGTYNVSVCVPQEVIEFAKKKPLPWKVLLKNLMQDLETEEDSSWFTPERKYLHMDLVLPGRCRDDSDELGNVWAFVDSSGSISKSDLGLFLNELWHILRGFRCEMNLAYWDTSVTDIYPKLTKEKDLEKAMPRHSGGTDINCVYQYIADHKLKPDVLLILTDGYFGQAKDTALVKRLHSKTIVVLTGNLDPDTIKNYGRVAGL